MACTKISKQGKTERKIAVEILGEAQLNKVSKEFVRDGLFNGFGKLNNGTPNKVFNHLTVNYPYNQAIKMYAALHTEYFESKYGNWTNQHLDTIETDINGFPVISEDATSFYVKTIDGKYQLWKKDTIDIASASVAITTKEPTSEPLFVPVKQVLTQSIIDTQSTKLKSLFAKQGLNVEVKADVTLEGSATILKDGEKVTVTYNPNRVKADSIFHEFGHLYTELITDKEFIQIGIEQLRDTDLWNKTKKTYPNYSDHKLGMEVLTTKIGQEAAKMNDSNFKLWLNLLFQRIGKLFGITPNVARNLATDLTRNVLNEEIDIRSTMEQQWQKDKEYAETLNIITKFIHQVRAPLNDYMRKEGKFLIDGELINKTKSLNKGLNDFFNNSSNDNPELRRFEMITSITNHDLLWIKEVEKEFFDLYNKYINNTYNDAELSYDEMLEFANRLSSLNTQLKTFTHLRDLEEISLTELLKYVDKVKEGHVTRYVAKEDSSFNEETKIYAQTLAELSNLRVGLASRVKALDNKFKVLTRKFGILTLANSKNKENLNNIADIFDKEMLDENTFQKYLMNNYDSINALVSASERIRRTLQIEYEFKAKRMIREFEDLMKELNISKDEIKELYLDDDGNETFKLVQEYDYSKFFEELNKDKHLSIESKLEKLNDIATIASAEEQEKRIKEEKAKIKGPHDLKGRARYSIWYQDSFEYNDDLGKFIPKIGGEFVIPNEKFKSTQYSKIHATINGVKNKLGKLYDYLHKTQLELTDHTIGLSAHHGSIPIIDTRNKAVTAPSTHINDEKGNTQRTLRFSNIAENVKKPTYHIPNKPPLMVSSEYEAWVIDYINSRYDKKFKSIVEIEAHNDEIKQYNKDVLKKSVSYDLNTIFPLFIKSSLDHKYKTEAEAHYISTLTALGNTQLKRRNKIGKPSINLAIFNQEEGKFEDSTIKGSKSNVYARFEKDMDMKLYSNFLEFTPYNNVAIHARNTAALLGLGFNMFSATKNLMMGHSQALSEAKAGIQYNTKDLLSAQTEYFSNFASITKDANSDNNTFTSKTSAILNFFNVIDDYNDIIERVNNLDIVKESTTVASQKFKKFQRIGNKAAYFLTVTAENNMHNETLLSMLKSHRIIDGKVVSRFIYTNGFKDLDTSITRDKEKFKQFIKDKKEFEEKRAKEFETTGVPMIDGLTLIEKDGRYEYELNEEVLSLEEYAAFKLKVQGVNHKLHGIYNFEDKGIIENKILGQLFMQFNHWLPAAWARRWGAEGVFGRTNMTWNERRQEFEIGDYNAIYKMFMQPVNNLRGEIASKSIVKKGTKEEEAVDLDSKVNFGEYVKTFLQGGFEYIKNAKLYYHTLNTYEQAAVRRGSTELSIAALTMILSTIITMVPPDDDDNISMFLYNYIIYALGGTRQELINLSPIGLPNEVAMKLKSPFATFTLAGNLFSILSDSVKYPFQDDKHRRLQTGPNKDKLKVVRSTEKVIPLYNNTYRRFNNMATKGQNKYYSQWSW